MAKFEDLTGKQFGRLTVVERLKGKRGVLWRCKCECGGEAITNTDSLNNGRKRSCGCLLDEWRASRHTDLIGQRFGKLVVIGKAKSDGKRTKYRCRCDCGNEIETRKDGLLSGHTKSCGCVHPGNRKHGLTYDRAYWVWTKIKARCYNQNCPEYRNYGGMGIKMCDEWKDDPKAFIEWAYANGYDAVAPKGQCTCDRIDVHGDYEPSNCRWITNQEQQNNRRHNVRAEYNGENHTAAEWSRILGIPYNTVRSVINSGKDIAYLINDYVPRNRG